MNRRNFLKSIGKICAVLPFVGSSSAVAKTGASEVRSGTRPATEEDVDEFDLFTGYRTKKPSSHCEICYEDCPHFLQCHGYDSRYMGSGKCDCPAPYKAAVSGRPVEHFDYCKARKKEVNFPFVMDWGKDKYKIDLV